MSSESGGIVAPKSSRIKIGAQNCHYSQKPGPFTGSINTDLIKSIGAKYVIIGHSENRVSGDTNNIINLKIKSALKKKLKIIFCIGETLKEKKNNKTNLILNSQIIYGLQAKAQSHILLVNLLLIFLTLAYFHLIFLI